MKKTLFSALALLMIMGLVACDGIHFPALPPTVTTAETEETDTAETQENTTESATDGTHVIVLSGDSATLDGTDIEVFDYTWHCDPTVAHDEVKNAPAEYYTGTEPMTDAAAYIDHELFYYPELPADDFKLVKYDGEQEWAYYYKDGENEDFIFATLPHLGASFPAQMMHSETEAAANQVLHITEPGTYSLEGTWAGQIWVDLGDEDETFTDENAKVTVILNGVDITCTVAPGIVFYSAFECDNTWEDADEHTANVDTANAGVSVIIADDTANSVTGANVFRMLKTKYKDETSTDKVRTQKKMRKTDGAFYSYVTMNIDGQEKKNGTLEITSGFEGLDSELHMSLLGGEITINSQDDGINVNEDNVSVVIFDGANVTLNAALGAEGDGVDSNGFIVVNSGTISVNGIVPPDNALDSEDGIYYNGGQIIIDGNEQTLEPGSVSREIGGGMGGHGGPGGPGDMGDFGGKRPDGSGVTDWSEMFSDFDIKEFKKKVAELDDDATIEDVFELFGIDGVFDIPGFGGGMGGPGGNGGFNPFEEFGEDDFGWGNWDDFFGGFDNFDEFSDPDVPEAFGGLA